MKFIKCYKIKKLEIFYNSKDHIQFQQKAHVVYRIQRAVSYNKFIGKKSIFTKKDVATPDNYAFWKKYLTEKSHFLIINVALEIQLLRE